MGWFAENVMPNIPIVGNVIQGIYDAQVQKRNVDKTISANKQLAEYQYSKDLEMWNRANAYNTPLAQRERLKAAGINPNISAGLSSTGTTATALPKYQAPSVRYDYKPYTDIPQVISQYQDFTQRQAQIDLLREQKRLTENKATAEELSPARIQALIDQAKALTQKYGLDLERGTWQQALDYQYGRSERNYNLLNMQNRYWIGKEDIQAKRRENYVNWRTVESRIQNWVLRNQLMASENKNRQEQLKKWSFDLDKAAWEQTQRKLGIDEKAPWWAKLGGSWINKIKEYGLGNSVKDGWDLYLNQRGY